MKEKGNSLAEGEWFLQANRHLDKTLEIKVIEKSAIEPSPGSFHVEAQWHFFQTLLFQELRPNVQ